MEISIASRSARPPLLAGCAIGEILGMFLGTAFGWATCRRSPSPWDWPTHHFGLTSLPLFRARADDRAIVPITLAVARYRHDHGGNRQPHRAADHRGDLGPAGVDDPLLTAVAVVRHAYPFAFLTQPLHDRPQPGPAWSTCH